MCLGVHIVRSSTLKLYNFVMGSSKRVALITGASRGIGAGITKYLIDKGYFVHGTYLKDKDLIEKEFAKTNNFMAHHLDVGNEKSVMQTVDELERTSGVLHLLVNNAAVDYNIGIEELSLEKWEETFNVRVKGTFLMTKHSLSLLKKSGRATIVNITSSWAHETQPSFPAAGAGGGPQKKLFQKPPPSFF